MVKHDARARYCIEVGVPREHLRDDIRCEACDELHTLMHLDPTVTEILTREPWCTACQAADPVHPPMPVGHMRACGCPECVAWLEAHEPEEQGQGR